MILLVRLLVQPGSKQWEVSVMRSPKWWLSLAKSEKRKESVVCLHSLRRPPPQRNHVPSPLVLLCSVISHRWAHSLGKGGVTKKALKLREERRAPGKQDRWWVATWCCLMLSMVTTVIGHQTLDQSYPIRTTCCLKKVIETTAWPPNVIPTGVPLIALDGKRKPIHTQPILTYQLLCRVLLHGGFELQVAHPMTSGKASHGSLAWSLLGGEVPWISLHKRQCPLGAHCAFHVTCPPFPNPLWNIWV